MPNTHFNHRNRHNSFSERRLITFADHSEFLTHRIDVGGETIELDRFQWEKWKRLEKQLNLAVAQRGSVEVQKNWEDPNFRNAVIASVVFREDDRTDLLPKTAEELARAADEAFRNEPVRVEEWKEILTDYTNDFTNSVVKARKSIERGKNLFDGPLGNVQEDGGVSYPQLRKMERRVREMEALLPDLEKRMFTLVEVARSIAKTPTDIDFAEMFTEHGAAMTAIQVRLDDGSTVTLRKHLEDKIASFGPTDQLAQRKTALMESLEIAAKIYLPDGIEADIEAAIDQTETDLAAVDAVRKTDMQTRLKVHIDSLSRIGGNHVGDIVEMSIQSDGKFNHDLLKNNLGILGIQDVPTKYPAIEAAAGITAGTIPLDETAKNFILSEYPTATHGLNEAKLMGLLTKLLKEGKPKMETHGAWIVIRDAEALEEQARLGTSFDPRRFERQFSKRFFDQLLEVWDRKPLIKHLGTAPGLQLDTSHGTSFSSMVMRARMPESVAKDLVDGAIADDISVSSLIELSKLQNADIVDPAAAALPFAAEQERMLLLFLFKPDKDGKALLDRAHRGAVTPLLAAITANPGVAAHKDALLAFFDANTDIDGDAKTQTRELLDQFIEAKGGLTPTGAEKIAEQLTQNNTTTGEVTLHGKEHTLQMLTFLFLEEHGGLPVVKRAEEARAKAEAAFKLLLNNKIITKVDTKYVVKDKDSNNIALVLQRMNVGAKAARHIREMRANKIHEITYYGASKIYLGTIWSDASTGVDSWWKRMKDIPKTFWNPVADARSLKNMNQSRALSNYQEMLDGLLEGRSEGMTKMRGVHTQILAYEQDQREAVEAKTPENFKDQMRQGMYLVNAASLAREQLKLYIGEETYRDLPPRVRQVALWIALHKGKEGLKEAREFLEGYFRAPKAFEFFAEKFDTYLNHPNPGTLEFEEVITALRDFHMITGMDGTIFLPLNAAIQKYQLACDMPGSNPAEIAAREAAKQAARPDLEKAFKRYAEIAEEFDATNKDLSSRRNNYLRSYLMNLDPEERRRVVVYLKKIEMMEQIHGFDTMDRLKQDYDLSIRPLALIALAESRVRPDEPGVQNLATGSHALDNWLGEGDRDFSREPLDIVLKGPKENKHAFIEAYVSGNDQRYVTMDASGNEVVKTVTAARAIQEVAEIKRLLEYHSNTHHDSLQVAQDYEETFTNPLDKGLRLGIDTLRDLWAGDAVDKAKVAVAVVAAIWLLKTIWKKGSQADASGLMKLAKWSMVGLPILMVANSMEKTRSGRDRLGELFLYMPPKQRRTALERWRRRAKDYEHDTLDHSILNTLAGVTAIDELTDADDPIDVELLLQWHDTVRKDGYKNYGKHLSPQLRKQMDIDNVMFHLGRKGGDDPEEAYEVMYTAFDGLCRDVAFLHDRTEASWGRRFLWSEYVELRSYDGSDISDRSEEEQTERAALRERLSGRTITMLDVIISESRLRAKYADPDEERTFMENIGHWTGISASAAGRGVKRLAAHAEVAFHRSTEYVDGLWKVVKEKGPGAAAAVWDIMRVGGDTAWNMLKADAKKAWELAYKSLSGAGLYIVRNGPDAFSWAMDKGAEISLGTMHGLYEFVDEHPLLGGDLLRSFEGFLDDKVGGTISELIALKLRIPEDNKRVRKLAERTAWKVRLETSLKSTITTVPTGPQVDSWIVAEAQTMGILTPAQTITSFDTLSPFQKMMVYEQVRKKVHCRVLAAYLDQVALKAGNPNAVVTPIPGIVWNNNFTLNADEAVLEKSFGRRTTRFLNNQAHWAGDLGAFGQSLQGKPAQQIPVEMAAWVTDIFQRYGADEHANTPARVHKERFLEEAKRVIPDSLNKDTIINYYTGYLDTIFANVAIETALDAAGRHRQLQGAASNQPAMSLAIADAKDMLIALKTLRASSASPGEINTAASDETALMKQLEVFNTTGPLPPNPARRGGGAGGGGAGAGGPGMGPAAGPRQAQQAAEQDADTLLNTPLDPNNPGHRAQALDFMASAPTRRDQLRNALLPYYNDMAKIKGELSQRLAGLPAGPKKEATRFMLNSACAKMLRTTIDGPGGFNSIPLASLGNAATRQQWQDKLFDLYKTVKEQSSDRVSTEIADNVSTFLEVARYYDPASGKVLLDGQLGDYTNFVTGNGAVNALKPSTIANFARGVPVFGRAGEYGAATRFTSNNAVLFNGGLDNGHYGRRLSQCENLLGM